MNKSVPPGVQLRKAFQRKAILKNPFLKYGDAQNAGQEHGCISSTKGSPVQQDVYDRQLYMAVLRGNMKQVMAAISNGANVKQVDEQGRELILNAIVQTGSKCTPLILKVLLDAGCAAETKDLESGEPLLIAIVRRNKLELCKTVLEHSSCKPWVIHSKDAKGRTAIMWSAYKKYEKTVTIFVIENADAKDVDNANSNAFLWSSRHNCSSEFLWEDEYDGPKYWLQY